MDISILPHAASAPTTAALKFMLDQIVGCVFWQAAYCSISEPYRQGLFKGPQGQKLSMQAQVGLRAARLAPAS